MRLEFQGTNFHYNRDVYVVNNRLNKTNPGVLMVRVIPVVLVIQANREVLVVHARAIILPMKHRNNVLKGFPGFCIAQLYCA